MIYLKLITINVVKLIIERNNLKCLVFYLSEKEGLSKSLHECVVIY